MSKFFVTKGDRLTVVENDILKIYARLRILELPKPVPVESHPIAQEMDYLVRFESEGKTIYTSTENIVRIIDIGPVHDLNALAQIYYTDGKFYNIPGFTADGVYKKMNARPAVFVPVDSKIEEERCKKYFAEGSENNK